MEAQLQVDDIDRLERLCARKEGGLLTDEEFSIAKAALLLPRALPGSVAVPADHESTTTSTSTSSSSDNCTAQRQPPDDGLVDPSGLPEPPGFIRRLFALVPPREYNLVKDHFPSFREHWIESKRLDGRSLRADLVMLYESELIVACLLFGCYSTLMTSGAISVEGLSAFQRGEVASVGFWTVTMGTCCTILSFSYIIFSFLGIMLMLPIADVNVYPFCKLPSTRRFMNVVNAMMVLCVFGGLVFLSLLLHLWSGSSPLMLYLLVGVMTVPMMATFFTANYCFNLVMLGGFCACHLLCNHAARCMFRHRALHVQTSHFCC